MKTVEHTIYMDSVVSEHAFTPAISVDEHESLIVQAFKTTVGAWGASAVITIEASLDGDNWFAMPGGALTFSAAGVSARQDTRGIRFIRGRTSTAGTSGDRVRLTFNLTTETVSA